MPSSFIKWTPADNPTPPLFDRQLGRVFRGDVRCPELDMTFGDTQDEAPRPSFGPGEWTMRIHSAMEITCSTEFTQVSWTEPGDVSVDPPSTDGNIPGPTNGHIEEGA